MLTRHKPLERRTRMKKRRPRRLSRAGSDPVYLTWIRTLPCACCKVDSPFVSIHAHHAGRRPGVAMKAPDDTAIPLCERCHRSWHDANGPFKGLSRLERFAWSMRAVAETLAAFEAAQPPRREAAP